MSTRDSPGGKGGRCVRLTTYHPCSAERQEIWGLNLPGPPWAISKACCGRDLYLYLRILIVVYVFLDTATMTEVFPCFLLGCKRITSQDEARPALIQFLCCSMYCLFCIVLCIVLCKYVLLPQGDNPIVVNKYIISYQVLHVFIYCKRKIMQASNYVYT